MFLPESEPERTRYARELAKKLAELAIRRQGRKTGLLVGTINGEAARQHFVGRFLEEAGFVNTAAGFQMRRVAPVALPSDHNAETEDDSDDDPDVSETA